jgi:nitrite reductase (NADH) large subunit
MSSEYVIIGNGIAGISAARAIRDRDPEGRIVILGEENVLPYNRIMLSKQLMQTLNPEAMLLQSPAWYRDLNIHLHNNSRAVGLDLDNRQVLCSDSQTLAFHRLLIATGARNRVPPVAGAEAPGVYSIRQLADVQRMQQQLQESTGIVLIGGGIQNLETAWTLVQKGKRVVLVEAAQRLMPRLLDEEASRITLHNLEKSGVEVHLGAWMERIDPGLPLQCVLSSGTRLTGDAVIYATGIMPNAELVAGTPLSAGEGIGVDAYLQTRVADVYAAGDVTQCQGMVCGLWNTAAVQGRIAGLNMTGGREIYQPPLPVTTFNAFSLALFSMGQPYVRDHGWTATESDPAQNRYVRVFIEDDRLVGAIVIGERSVIPLLRGAMEKKTRIAKPSGSESTLAAVIRSLQ